MEYLKTQPGRIGSEKAVDHLRSNGNLNKSGFRLGSLAIEEQRTQPEVQQYLEKNLAVVEELMISQVISYHPDLRAATQVLLSSNGKRLRPRIILLIGRMLNADYDRLITLATSIEMLHTATLVHDDLIDGALLRRGTPTLNSKWSPAATVLTGDFLFACASRLASKTNSIEILSLFSQCLMTIVNGEVNQLFSAHAETNLADYQRRIYAKTASLYETSSQSAALLCGVDPLQVDLLRKYGYNLGMAFQIVDDILDYVGSELTLGKPVGNDLRQGLITLPLIYFMQANPEHPGVLKIKSGETIQDTDELWRILVFVQHSEAIHLAQADALEYARRAEGCLVDFPDSPERDELINISRFIVERKK